MNKKLKSILIVIVLIAGPCAWAEEKSADVVDLQALRKAVQSDRKALVASTLALTDTEAKRFWPLYDAYQRDVDMANRRRVVAVEGLVSRDKPLSDLYAKNLASELIAADEAEVKARRAMQNRLMRGIPTRILPPKKAARYLQLEAKIRAVQAYDIASAIPLIK